MTQAAYCPTKRAASSANSGGVRRGGAPSGVRWGCRPVAWTMGSRGAEHARAKTMLRGSIALMADRRRVPAAAGPPVSACDGVRPAASGRRGRHSGCRYRVGQLQQRERSHRPKADPQVERPDSRRPRSAAADPEETSARQCRPTESRRAHPSRTASSTRTGRPTIEADRVITSMQRAAAEWCNGCHRRPPQWRRCAFGPYAALGIAPEECHAQTGRQQRRQRRARSGRRCTGSS